MQLNKGKIEFPEKSNFKQNRDGLPIKTHSTNAGELQKVKQLQLSKYSLKNCKR